MLVLRSDPPPRPTRRTDPAGLARGIPWLRCLTFSTWHAVGEHPVDDPVQHGFLGAHEVVAFHVLGDLLERLPAVLSDQLLNPPFERDRLPRLNLDVACLTLEAAPEL